MEKLIGRHFTYNKNAKNPQSDTITTHKAKADNKSGVIRLTFEGNRVAIVSPPLKQGQKTGTARILIDGKPPSMNPRFYTFTRTSKAPHMWWPAITQISSPKPLLLENWKLTFVEAPIQFKLTGSKTGPDGGGTTVKRFASNSGRIVIDRSHWMIASAVAVSKKAMSPGFEVTWSVQPMFVDTYTPTPNVTVTPVAWLMENREHTIEIIPNGDGPIPITAIRTHKPPWK